MSSLRPRLALVSLALLALSQPAHAASSQAGGSSYPAGGGNGRNGGSVPVRGSTSPGQQTETTPPTSPTPPPTTPAPTGVAVLLPNGKARAPMDAPAAVKKAIRAGNTLQTKPYRYGGGHLKWDDDAYDCSGAVSYALHGSGLLSAALDSSGLITWGVAGEGTWMTVYANPNHTFVVIAGLRLDTGAPSERGPRWRTTTRPTGAFTARHPAGL